MLLLSRCFDDEDGELNNSALIVDVVLVVIIALVVASVVIIRIIVRMANIVWACAMVADRVRGKAWGLMR